MTTYFKVLSGLKIETNVNPIEYRGYLIYVIFGGKSDSPFDFSAQIDIVKDGKCYRTLTGIEGAKSAIDTMLMTSEEVSLLLKSVTTN